MAVSAVVLVKAAEQAKVAESAKEKVAAKATAAELVRAKAAVKALAAKLAKEKAAAKASAVKLKKRKAAKEMATAAAPEKVAKVTATVAALEKAAKEMAMEAVTETAPVMELAKTTAKMPGTMKEPERTKPDLSNKNASFLSQRRSVFFCFPPIPATQIFRKTVPKKQPSVSFGLCSFPTFHILIAGRLHYNKDVYAPFFG